MFRSLNTVLLALTLGGPVAAQIPGAVPGSADALHSPGREVTISLLTMGNGSKVWELFGHTAVWIRDDLTGRDTVFNWGVFDSSKPNFIPHFLQGLMLYQMGGETIGYLMYEYRYFNRSVVAQELNLTTQEKDSLLHLIQINAQPENVTYRYNYFRDNCSTRPRDMLDQVLAGQLHAQAKQTMPTSYRWHALRLMQGDRLLALGVNIGLGEPSDLPITKWDEAFLPAELHDIVAKAQVHDSAGALRPLVRGERVLFEAHRPPEFAAPPNMAPRLLIIGIVVAALFGLIGMRATTGDRVARVVAAILFSIWSLAAGLLGTVLALLWTVTDHTFAHGNENLLLFNPLWLALVVLAPLAMMSGRAARATRVIAATLAVLSLGALLFHLVRLSSQSNLSIVALGLPPALAIAMVLRAQSRAVRNAPAE